MSSAEQKSPVPPPGPASAPEAAPVPALARGWFALRALVAVGMMLGFYALAVAIVATMLWLVYLQVVLIGRVQPKLVLICLAVAFAVLKGCFFLADPFQPPGPELSAHDHPELFALIARIAHKVGARAPQAVYLVPDVNAFVADVGGWMGIVGTRRVMGIGLGLLSMNTTGELTAAIAHEFGHFQGGDTLLGGFLYRTRASIGRVIGALGAGSWLSKLFEWYGKLFLRVTHSLSRRQELDADTLAVSVAGAGALTSGLRGAVIGGVFFDLFLKREVAPIIDEGCIPVNLYEGYRAFLSNLERTGVVTRVGDELARKPTDPYDTHPSLEERIAHARALPDPAIEAQETPARALIAGTEAVERAMTQTYLGAFLRAQKKEPRLLEWSQVPEVVYRPRLERASRALGDALGNADDGGVGGLAAWLTHPDRLALVRRVAPQAFADPCEDPNAVERAVALTMATSRIALTLVRQKGWRLTGAPGKPLAVESPAGESLDLDSLAAPAVKDPAAAAELVARLKTLGL